MFKHWPHPRLIKKRDRVVKGAHAWQYDPLGLR
jgi:hypothetical protein